MRWIVEGKEIMTLFVIPSNTEGLLVSIAQFLLVVLAIVVFERVWVRRFRDLPGGVEWRLHRILLWEFGTLVMLVGSYLLHAYYVVLPLLFLLAFLSMWYLLCDDGFGPCSSFIFSCRS